MNTKNSDYSRRKFLATTATGVVSAGLAGLSPHVALAQESEPPTDTKKAKEIIYRHLGKSDIKVPIVSMGAGGCNDPGVIQASYELGVRHFDTASNYGFGSNEQLVGGVLNKMGVRDKAVIGSKIYTPAQRRGVSGKAIGEKLMKLTEGALKRLKSDYIDILYIHDVNSGDVVKDPDIIDGMAAIKSQGKARLVALSTHANMTEVINAATETKFWDVVLTSINFTLADDAALLGAIEAASKAGIGFIGMKVMAGGARWPNPDTHANYSSETIAKACLKWVLHNEHVNTVIPSYNNHEYMRINFSVASDPEYSEEEKELLSDNNITLGMGFCRQCRTCLAHCPYDVDIPTLIRTHMYAAQYGNFSLARATLDEIPSSKGIKACVSCESCLASCAHSVDIDRRLTELKLMYA